MEDKFILCKCGTLEHQIVLWFDPIEPEELYVSIFLNNHQNIFKRVWIAIKYVFGYKSRYGHWDELILGEEQARKLYDTLNKFLRPKGYTLEEILAGMDKSNLHGEWDTGQPVGNEVW